MENNDESCRGKLLVIDDEPNLSDLLAKWLKNIGYEHEFVDDYEEAAKRIEREDFDVIVHSHEFLTIKGLSAQFQPVPSQPSGIDFGR